MTELKRYELDDVRYYETPIGWLPSTTSVLRILNKPAIAGWAAKLTAESMRGVLADISAGKIKKKDLTEKEIDRLVKIAKSAYREIGKEAMDIGSAVHAWIEDYYVAILHGRESKTLFDKNPSLDNPLNAFLEWDRINKVHPIFTEERIWSNERYAGTLDLYAEVGGKPTLVDFKSSTGHYDENVLQIAAYDTAFRERTGHKIERYMVVRLDKNTGMPDPKEYSREEVELGAKRFLAILKYWWLTYDGKGLNNGTDKPD